MRRRPVGQGPSGGRGRHKRRLMKPAEGTILTVARLSAAKAGQAAQENSYFEFVHEAAVEEARVALANTVNQNPVLKKPGSSMLVARAGCGPWRPCSWPCGERM